MVAWSDDQDSRDHVVRREYDWSETDPTAAVVETLAAVADCETTELTPLYHFVDPGALDGVVTSSRPAPDGREAMVSFPVETRQVTVHGDGEVVVRETGPSRSGGSFPEQSSPDIVGEDGAE